MENQMNILNNKIIKKVLGDEYSLEDSNGYRIAKNDIAIAKNGCFETINKFEFLDLCEKIMINDYNLIVSTYNNKLNSYICEISSFYGGETKIYEKNDKFEAIIEAFKNTIQL